MLRLSGKSREQKKLAPSRPSSEDRSANVLAFVDFPVPACPYNQPPIFQYAPALLFVFQAGISDDGQNGILHP